MRMTLPGILLVVCLLPYASFSQDQAAVPSTGAALTQDPAGIPARFFARVQAKTASLDRRLTDQTDKYLARLSKQEARLRKKLYRQDSALAGKVFGQNPLDYSALSQKLQNAGSPTGTFRGSNYIPSLDSLQTSLKYLQQAKDLQGGMNSYSVQASASLAQVNQLQNKLQIAEQLRQLIRQRKEQIREALSQYTHLPGGLQSAYQGYSREAYYYGQQVQEYKSELSDPDKLTKRALGILQQTPAFQQFLQQNSQLAGLFSLPGGGIPGSAQPIPGLQTRNGVQQILQNQLASGGPNAQALVSQQIQSAQAQLKSLKGKVAQLGGGGSNTEIPDFKPNTQKTRPFFKRLEYGFNMQSVRSTYYFPVTTDFGLSLGYKLNDRASIGVGASYKMGWGKDISHIAVSSQGVGLRSYLDIKVKGSWYASGGFEYNYQQPFYSISQLRKPDAWSKSGLLGVTKKYSLGGKLKGNLQLLWDFLSYQQQPKGQAVVFRVGYNF